MSIYGLNTLRFFAFFAIFNFHYFPNIDYLYLGVDFFFVLSSFLLTFLYFQEVNKYGRFNRFNFFIRRSLRIFPLYYAVVFSSIILLPIFFTGIKVPDDSWMYWFFLSNYEVSDSIYALKFLWSIAVEEQFYLLFIIFSGLFQKHIIKIIILLLIISLAYEFFVPIVGASKYFHTIYHFPNFALGMLGGYLFYHRAKFLYEISRNVYVLIIIIGLLFLFINIEYIFNVILSLCFMIIIGHVASSNRNNHFQIFSLTEKLGHYTYGLYVYSGFILTFNSKFIHMEFDLLKYLITISLLILLSYTSYTFFEKFFLKQKKHFYPR